MTDPQLRPLGTYDTGVFDESAAEIPAYDPNTQRVFVVKANEAAIDVLDISDPTDPNFIGQIDVSSFGAIANSVAVNQNGIVAVAIEADVKQDLGTVAFFDADGNTLNQVTVGALPDMLTFTSDGTKVLVANE
ncbi:MAG: calcium-binding protein, partial [Okeania sp. SIO2D1]|nr:calcium-binding protein [Okeania sp. SIO2D1]